MTYLQVAAYIAAVLKNKGDSPKTKTRDPCLIICDLPSIVRWQDALLHVSSSVRPLFCCGGHLDVVRTFGAWATRQWSCFVTTFDILENERDFFQNNFYWSTLVLDCSSGTFDATRYSSMNALVPNISCKVCSIAHDPFNEHILCSK